MAAFAGREAELALLERAVDDASLGRARLVVVDGPAGSGKTRLVHELLARRPGARARRAVADEHETGLAYGLVGQLWPDQARPGAREDPVTVGMRLLELLGDGVPPQVLVVDDAQWCDALSLRALVFALRRLTIEPLCVLALARPEPPGGLQALLRVAGATGGVSLGLTGLDERAAAHIATSLGRTDLTRAQLRDLVRHTDGNALHLTELLTDIAPSELSGAALALPTPRSLAALVGDRLASCSPAAVRLVAAAVVVSGGSGSSLVETAELAGVADPLPALDEAVAAGLLHRRGTPPDIRVAPPHALLVQAALQHLPVTLLAEIHRAAADRTSDEPTRLRHLVAAATGHRDEALAALVGRRTAELARTGRAAVAFRLTAQAAGLVRDPDDRSDLLLEAVQQALAASEPGAAASLLADVPAGRAPARTAFLRGVLALHQRDHLRAKRELELAWDRAPEDDDELRADIAGQLAGLELVLGHGASCASWAARSRPAPHMVIPPDGLTAMGLAVSGRVQEALRALPPVGPERRGSPLPLEHLGTVTVRGIVEMFADDLDGALADLSAAAAAAGSAGQVFTRCYALANLAEVEHRRGRWDAALLHSQAVVSAVADADVQLQLAPVHALCVPVPARRGQWDAADRHVRTALAVAGDGVAPTDLGYAVNAAAQLAAARGDDENVVRATQVLLGREADGLREPGYFQWQELRAAALVHLRRLDEAETLLVEQEHLAHRREHRSASAAAARVRGLLEDARGRRTAAQASFEAALELHRGLQMPFERAVTEASYGAALQRWGGAAAGAAHLEAAARVFRELRAGPYLRRVEQALRPASRPRTGVDERLTPQQVAVAQLVTAGMRNREIAAELFISVKTVEYHLRSVYAKLGISSRSQLVRWMSTSSADGPEGPPRG